MRVKRIKDFDEFMDKNYIVCPHCNYNNKIENVRTWGDCLNCGKILDEKLYFTKKLRLEIKKEKKKEGLL